MIEKIELCINHSIKVGKLNPGCAHVSFKPGYNALIGRNGSGKSTVLRAVALCPMCRVYGSRDGIKYITTETLNPKFGGIFATRELMVQGIRAMFRSHGQCVLDSLRSQSHTDETVVLIDSPETGQDLDNEIDIHRGLLKMAEKYQVIVATNSLVFMRNANLIDLGKESLARLIESVRKISGDFG
ncbi:MAG: AAA family ATPase [Acidobacteria bacterium]|nr:AAA family ATPase [Acidobacteriota bacterium]